jgi:hypothetical protein
MTDAAKILFITRSTVLYDDEEMLGSRQNRD